MVRSPVTRTALTVPRFPISALNLYNMEWYGDSQVDIGATSTADNIGGGLRLFTCTNYVKRDFATGGWRLDQIRGTFVATFPLAGSNCVGLQGGINDVVQDISLSVMQGHMAFMADTVIAAGTHQLIITSITPMMTTHAAYTVARGKKILDFNAWAAATYTDYYVDTYTPLESVTVPGDLAPEYRKYSSPSTVDLHIGDNGCRKLEEVIAVSKLQNVNTSLTVVAGNITEFPRVMTSWSSQVNCSIGGPSILLADGTYSTLKGILPLSLLDTVKQFSDSYTAVSANQTVKVKILLRPGELKWCRMSYSNNASTAFVRYLNLIDLIRGAGTGDWRMRRIGNGWVECFLICTNGATGTAANNINLQPSRADSTPGNVALTLEAPLMYVDSAEMIVL